MCLTGSLLPILIKGIEKGKLDVFLFLTSNTLQVICLFALVAVNLFCVVNSVNMNNIIANMLHFKAHLVFHLHGAYETLPFM